MKPIIYLDMDDVLASLSEDLSKFVGVAKEKLISDRDALFQEYLPQYAANDGFLNQGILPNAKAIVKRILQLHEYTNVGILTSCGSFYHSPSMAYQKKEWIERNFPELCKVPFCATSSGRDKAFLAHPKAMLIDDHSSNITHFNAAGGVGVLYDYEDQKSLENVFLEIDKFVYSHSPE